MILLFFAAFLGGFLSTLPLGPLNLRLVLLHLKKQKCLVFYFQLGILASDGCLSILSFYSSLKTKNYFSQFLPYKDKILLIGEVIFVCLLLFMSFSHIYSFLKQRKLKKEQEINKKIDISSFFAIFLSGVVGTLTIPGLVPFWYFWWIGFSRFLQNTHFFFMFVIIFVGVILGDSLVFLIYRYFADFMYENNKNKFFFVNIELIVGLIFLLVAMSFIVSTVI